MADIEKLVWFRLLNEWRQRSRRGLTLPFLVGAVLREEGKLSGTRLDIGRFLNEIKSHEDDHKIVMFGWCADLGVPILHLEYAEHALHTYLFEPTDEFFVIEKSLGRYLCIPDHDKAELLDVLVDLAERPVSEGRYSLKRVAGKLMFEQFDQEDLQLIDDALQSG